MLCGSFGIACFTPLTGRYKARRKRTFRGNSNR
ncbi:hypothetical protein KB973_004569 [Vibrio parahaemolyticus]|nr:hypothetical protein [Vibrio parahaemolyticus]